MATFDVPSPANADATNEVVRFDRNGEVVGSHDLGKAPLLGLAFDATNNQVYVASVGNFAGGDSKIQRIAADLTGLIDVAVIPGIGAPEPRTVGNPDGSSDTITFGDNARVPNAMAFDGQGNLYVSDSFQGAVFKITDPQACAPNCAVETFVHHPLLATTGFPAFAANGIAVNADGLAFHHAGRLWAAANQADEVVALNESGGVVARLGEFRGLSPDGTPTPTQNRPATRSRRTSRVTRSRTLNCRPTRSDADNVSAHRGLG